MNIYQKRHPIHASAEGLCFVPGYKTIEVAALTPPAAPYKYMLTGMVTSQLDVTFAASLDFPGSFVGELKGGMHFYLLDLLAMLPQTPDPSGEYLGLVWGVGVRLGFAASNFSSNLNASIGGVAAAASMGLTTSQATCKSVGLGAGILKEAGEFFSGLVGDFDANKLQDIGKGLQIISQYMITNASTLAPRPVYAISQRPKSELAKVQAASTACAIGGIIKKRSFNETVETISQSSSPLASAVSLYEVAALYQKFINSAGDDKPSATQAVAASEYFKLSGYEAKNS